MGNITGSSIGMFAIMIVLLVFMNIFQVLIFDSKLDQMDTFLIKKVSIHNGFTPTVETELSNLLQRLNINRSNLDFTGTTTSPVYWGETVYITYEVNTNFVQRGLDFLGIPNIDLRARSYEVIAMGR